MYFNMVKFSGIVEFETTTPTGAANVEEFTQNNLLVLL